MTNISIIRLLILFFFLFNSISIYGQKPIWDENDLKSLALSNPDLYEKEYVKLRKQLLNLNDTEQLVSLNQFHIQYLIDSERFNEVISLCFEMLDLNKDKPKKESIITYLNLATSYGWKNNKDSLDYWFNIVEKIIDEDSPYFGEFLLVESFKNSNEGLHALAIEKSLKAAKILESKGDQKNLAIAYNNIAFEFGRINDIENQNQYLLLAIEVNKSLGLSKPLISNYNNLGSNYKSQNNLQKALEYYDLAYKLLLTFDSPLLLAQNLTNRANIYEALEKYTIAEELFLQCERICKETNIDYGIMLTNTNLGNLYRLMGKYEESEERLEKSLKMSIDLKARREEALTYQRLFRLARDREDYKNAVQYQSLYHSLNDSLVNESVKREALELKEKYESEKKENQILLLSKNKVQQELIITVLALAIISILLGFYAFRKNQIAKLKEKEIQSEILRRKLEFTEKELLADSLKKFSVMNTKQMIMRDLGEVIKDIPQSHAQKFKKILNDLKSEIDESVINEFETRFTSIYEQFFSNLKDIAPDLTPTELKFAAFIRLNFSTKELSVITNRSIGTIDNIRSSIRKKLKLAEEESLYNKLIEI